MKIRNSGKLRHAASAPRHDAKYKCDKLATGFINDIWNNTKLKMLSVYLHPNFVDYSLPRGLQDAASLEIYLTELSRNIIHQTTIEKIIYEDSFVFLKVKIKLSALSGSTNLIADYQQDETISGYRILAISEQLITGHWEFL